MAVEVLTTGNDQERQFKLDHAISRREKTYVDSTEALSSPLASKIFGFPWTEAVTITSDSVKVTKQDWVEWSVLEEPLKGLIEEHFSEQKETFEENPEPEKKAPQLDSEEAKIIQELIESEINPALSSHGGYVVLHSVEDGVVYMEMGGGCQGCAMSYQTLKEGIEGAIKQKLPAIKSIVDVTNHGAGASPFYT